jgi:hypothetical protein
VNELTHDAVLGGSYNRQILYGHKSRPLHLIDLVSNHFSPPSTFIAPLRELALINQTYNFLIPIHHNPFPLW